MTLLLTETAGRFSTICGRCWFSFPEDHIIPHQRHCSPREPRPARVHYCTTPKWSYCDSGAVLCVNCGGWARTEPLPERILDEKRDDHFSNYTGWDGGFEPDPPPSLWQGHPWKE